ncbi:MAG: hypothetical protein EPO11_10170 [Gammaproteobacteria bacterium]|nr:MAG: hypothetical protein EPO11_10170 [Gammaproteobacteria bacterium]
MQNTRQHPHDAISLWQHLCNNNFSQEDYQVFAKNRGKKLIYKHIESLQGDAQAKAILQAINHDHPIGKLFWTQRGMCEPNLESGYLKKLVNLLRINKAKEKECQHQGYKNNNMFRQPTAILVKTSKEEIQHTRKRTV